MEIILMRHAESQHNVQKKLIKQNLSSQSVKNTAQYMSIRVNPSLKDEAITQKGLAECQIVASSLNWANVELILVSPMKRCLQTCQKFIQKSGKNIQVIAEPLLKGRLSNIWGYGSSLQQLKSQYPLYNFDNLNDQFQTPWYIKTLPQNKQQTFKSLRDSQKLLYQNLKQDYTQFKNRVFRLKSIINSYSQKLSPNGKMLIISHSCLLRTITSTSFNKKCKGVSQHKFSHIEPKTFVFSELFKCYESDYQKKQQQLNTKQ